MPVCAGVYMTRPEGSVRAEPGGTPEEPERPRTGRTAASGRWRRLWITVVAVLCVPVLVTAAGETAFYVLGNGAPSERAHTRGEDAMWLGHAWVDGRYGDKELAALAARLRCGGIRDLYLHTGPLGFDGTLPASLYPRAAWAIGALHDVMPGLRVHAWLGQRVERGQLDLSSPAVRANIVRSAEQVMAVGFDGIHYNFEPVTSGDPGLLALLDGTRAAIPRGRGMLSMSAHQVEPLPGLGVASSLVLGHGAWWTPGYLTQVAERLDQVAVMSYDTGQPTETLFSGYIRWQTRIAMDAVPSGTRLLMGVPAYHDDNWTHHPDAETMRAALQGVRLAIGEGSRANFGVALYVDFAATSTDWDAYQREWSDPPS
jgi:hypothetical protein